MMLKEAVNSVILPVMDDFSGAIYTMAKVEILGKFAGAVGNDNAHASAYTDVNWPQVAKQFVVTLGLSFNSYITQMFWLLRLMLRYQRTGSRAETDEVNPQN
ncbi:hypothetical protein Tco_1237053 [Tanacetum coccineum]